MWFRLARQFGMPVWQLQRIMPSSEFTYWCALELIDPSLTERLDYNSAMICHTMEQQLRGRDARPLEEFLLKFERQSPMDKAAAEAVGAKLKFRLKQIQKGMKKDG